MAFPTLATQAEVRAHVCVRAWLRAGGPCIARLDAAWALEATKRVQSQLTVQCGSMPEQSWHDPPGFGPWSSVVQWSLQVASLARSQVEGPPW
eukprot:7630760-Alexandrium_andersonii.AAC.1